MLQVQEEMLKVHWREDVLALPQCQTQMGGGGRKQGQGLIFLGPRIKMGIYEGTPTRVPPLHHRYHQLLWSTGEQVQCHANF